jgi:hypothetical protein
MHLRLAVAAHWLFIAELLASDPTFSPWLKIWIRYYLDIIT